MTKSSDKLMAIDGVAQYMGPIRGSRHYAGLWVHSFASYLGWTVDIFDETRSRSSEWRAPIFVASSLTLQWRKETLLSTRPLACMRTVRSGPPSSGHTPDDEPIYCLRLLESENRRCSFMLRRVGPKGRNLYQRHGLLIFNASANLDNDIWNGTWTKWSPGNYQKGYPHWRIGDSMSVVNII
ncbi:hypothetical protein GGR53DRAFT_465873 [Hypoxylon sp. FL1150]|nr:hypothetical protein GGR53DRAFT_465873 [Hypoxylon sp. FL1150]